MNNPPKKMGKNCFVIMPFGGWFDQYFESVYRPAIESNDFEAKNGKDLRGSGAIIGGIWDCIKQSHLVLAELTGNNPNVLYELGVAHAMAKPAILISEKMEDVPFNLKHLPVIIYDKNEIAWGEVLKQNIASTIQNISHSPANSVPLTFIPGLDLVSDIPENKKSLEQKILYEVNQSRLSGSKPEKFTLSRDEATSVLDSYKNNEYEIVGIIRSEDNDNLIIEMLCRLGVSKGFTENELGK